MANAYDKGNDKHKSVHALLEAWAQQAPQAVRAALACYDSCIEEQPPLSDVKAFVAWQQCCRRSLSHISSLVKLLGDIERIAANRSDEKEEQGVRQALIVSARRRLQMYLAQGKKGQDRKAQGEPQDKEGDKGGNKTFDKLRGKPPPRAWHAKKPCETS
ncbi:MAG: hypothetical protein GDA50_02480 [Alphaproteobacteria bacterium GM202ARS2]|nr:hypothetical protein [Alphaproteobacteria bacterium GM202ARS2]